MRPISGFSDCAARLRMHDALAPLLVTSPGSGPPGSPNLSPKVFGRASTHGGRLVLGVDDYQKEIADLETQVERLVEEEGDARTIAELTMQLEILKAIYARASDLYGRGLKDEGLRYGLRIQGYGDWTIDNVYAFVYERSVELEPRAHSAFVGGIKAADFALMLNP